MLKLGLSQVSTYVSTSQAALVAGREEAGQVSAAALEGAMGTLRGEVEGIQVGRMVVMAAE